MIHILVVVVVAEEDMQEEAADQFQGIQLKV